jgi:hypothetical protein
MLPLLIFTSIGSQQHTTTHTHNKKSLIKNELLKYDSKSI